MDNFSRATQVSILMRHGCIVKKPSKLSSFFFLVLTVFFALRQKSVGWCISGNCIETRPEECRPNPRNLNTSPCSLNISYTYSSHRSPLLDRSDQETTAG
uniref:Putative saposin n=1 Tax=Ixodes ricinus TaxID=34613 RepID=A0A0K8RJA4_IXORI